MTLTIEQLTRLRDEGIDALLKDGITPRAAMLGLYDLAASHLRAAEWGPSKEMIALCSLTPGGSEYANDPDACVNYVRKIREMQHDTIVKFKTERDQAREELSRNIPREQAPASPVQAQRPEGKVIQAANALVDFVDAANDLHAVFTIKDSEQFKTLRSLAQRPEGVSPIYRCNKHGGYGFVSDCEVCKGTVRAAPAEAVKMVPDDMDLEAIAWAINKLRAFGVLDNNQQNALMADRLEAMLAAAPERGDGGDR